MPRSATAHNLVFPALQAPTKTTCNGSRKRLGLGVLSCRRLGRVALPLTGEGVRPDRFAKPSRFEWFKGTPIQQNTLINL